jgi:hypothetical protein
MLQREGLARIGIGYGVDNTPRTFSNALQYIIVEDFLTHEFLAHPGVLVRPGRLGWKYGQDSIGAGDNGYKMALAAGTDRHQVLYFTKLTSLTTRATVSWRPYPHQTLFLRIDECQSNIKELMGGRALSNTAIACASNPSIADFRFPSAEWKSAVFNPKSAFRA